MSASDPQGHPDPHKPWTIEDYKRAIKDAADAWYNSQKGQNDKSHDETETD